MKRNLIFMQTGSRDFTGSKDGVMRPLDESLMSIEAISSENFSFHCEKKRASQRYGAIKSFLLAYFIENPFEFISRKSSTNLTDINYVCVVMISNRVVNKNDTGMTNL